MHLPSWTTGHDLDLILNLVPQELVPAAARPAMLSLARRLPSLDFGFEVRLHDTAAPIDFSTAAAPAVPADFDVLAGAVPEHDVAPDLRPLPAWQLARRMAQQLREFGMRGSPLDARLWLEFDRAAMEGPRPEPCLLLECPAKHAENLVQETDNAYRLVCGEPTPPVIREAVARLDRQRPAGVTVPTIGVMTGREGLPLRLRTFGWPAAELALALREIWGVEASERLLHAAAVHEGFEPALHVTLDFYADRAPRVGLPIPIWPFAPAAEKLARLHAIIDWMVRVRLCRPEVAPALLGWNGWCHDIRPITGAPHRHASAEMLPVLMRYILQFKLGFDGDGELRAKAYPGVSRVAVRQRRQAA